MNASRGAFWIFYDTISCLILSSLDASRNIQSIFLRFIWASPQFSRGSGEYKKRNFSFFSFVRYYVYILMGGLKGATTQPYDKNVPAWHVFILCCRISRTRWLYSEGIKISKNNWVSYEKQTAYVAISNVITPIFVFFFKWNERGRFEKNGSLKCPTTPFCKRVAAKGGNRRKQDIY